MNNSIILKVYSDRTIKRISRKIKLLGLDCKYKVMDVLNFRLLTSMLLLIFFMIFIKNGYILGPIAVALFLYLSEYYMFDLPIKKRTIKLENEAIFFFEILSLTLQSGKNLTQGLRLATNSLTSELSKEFKKSLDEVNLGKSFPEALNDMKLRIPSDTINNAILNIVESSIFGNNIEESLDNQLEFVRDKQTLRIKGDIGKLPTKIRILSVVFFIQIILMVILAPVLINYITK